MKHGMDAVFARESSDKPVQIEFFLFLFELFSLTKDMIHMELDVA